MLPWLVLITDGFNLTCSKSSNYNFPSNVHRRNDIGSNILYTTIGPTYFTDTFLDEVLSWLIKGDIIYFKSPDPLLNSP